MYNNLFGYNQIRNVSDNNRARQVISGTFIYFHGFRKLFVISFGGKMEIMPVDPKRSNT